MIHVCANVFQSGLNYRHDYFPQTQQALPVRYEVPSEFYYALFDEWEE